MSRIVQVANFVTSTSGGLRTTLEQLAHGYAAAGHEVIQVLPGAQDEIVETPWGRRVCMRAPEIPLIGYRLLYDVRRVVRELEQAEPDRIEVHDRTTLRPLGRWARDAGVPSLVVSHERLDRWLHQWLPARLPLDRAADRSNASLAAAFDTVVCTTAWADQEFRRLGVEHLHRVPLGVDLGLFQPGDPARSQCPLLVMSSRLSKEKRPDLAIAATAELLERGTPVRLVVAGHGPLRSALGRQAAGLPVEFLGYLGDRGELARLLGSADVFVAPGPVETFGLAALEALACGTPVVANIHSAVPEVTGPAGWPAASTPRSFADAVTSVLAADRAQTRLAARARAEQFPWSATVSGFLRVHALPVVASPLPARLP